MRAATTISYFKAVAAAALLLQLAGACKEKYVPKVNYPHTGYLVVDGFIDASGNISEFRLSKTTTLDSAYIQPVTGATLTIETENGQVSPLFETSDGKYSGQASPLSAGTRSRLHIVTFDAREYYSDYSSAHITPPVDSVNWQERNKGIQIYVSAHDPQNNTRYYKWRFDETWKYTARYFSSLVWDPPSKYSFRLRTPDENIYTCWKSDTSSDILLGSTLKLASDVLAEQPVTFIPYSETFNKLYNRYSINVYMEALSADEYAWYDKLRKNTESLGSIFDAQPSELTGNIHSVSDSTETVIGWVGCHTVTQSRIFINHSDLPSNPFLDNGYSACETDTLFFVSDADRIQTAFLPNGYLLALDLYTAKGALNPSGVTAAPSECADCRLKGGVLMRPYFWQD